MTSQIADSETEAQDIPFDCGKCHLCGRPVRMVPVAESDQRYYGEAYREPCEVHGDRFPKAHGHRRYHNDDLPCKWEVK